MTEPARHTNLDTLEPYVADRVRRILERMKARGYDPMVFETRRSVQRQHWLYGIGRTHDLHRSPVTWTLKSKHIVGKAVDIISRSRFWNWPQFYTALKQEANREGMTVLSRERCHIQWGG